MGNIRFNSDDEEDLPEKKKPTAVVDLPYYETLRTILEPYIAVSDEAKADKTFSTSEIIRSIEEHHGVFQGPGGKCGPERFVYVEDFTRAMTYLGFHAKNLGGLGLQWLMKKK